LIPILSYVAARGRCRHCGASIGRFHLLIELAALLVAVWAATVDGGQRLWADCVLGWTLLALAWIDARHMILPDVLTLPLVLAGLVFAWFLEPELIAEHAIGAAAGWVLFWGISRLYRMLRGRDGLGEGDAKLMAGAGAWVSWMGLGPVMLVGAATGLVVAVGMHLRGKDLSGATAIPFGPPLAFGIWVVWLYGALILPT
jgi:leader peptidase (prepilin peptidase)/N-methyltransferase